MLDLGGSGVDVRGRELVEVVQAFIAAAAVAFGLTGVGQGRALFLGATAEAAADAEALDLFAA